MSAKLFDRELMYVEVCNYYINGITTLVVNRDYYLKLLKYNLIDRLPFNLIVKSNECQR